MAVVGEAGHVGEAEDDGGVPRDHPAPLQRLGDDDVVDRIGFDARPCDHGADRDLGEAERVDADQRALAGATDRRTGGGDDDGIGHDDS